VIALKVFLELTIRYFI